VAAATADRVGLVASGVQGNGPGSLQAAGDPDDGKGRGSASSVNDDGKTGLHKSDRPDGEDPDQVRFSVGFDTGKTIVNTKEYRSPTTFASQNMNQSRPPVDVNRFRAPTTVINQYRPPTIITQATNQYRSPERTLSTQTNNHRDFHVDLGVNVKAIKGVRMPLSLGPQSLRQEPSASQSDVKNRIINGAEAR